MEAELKFERENISGIGVVGSYLIDASRRLGVEIFDDCGRLGLCDSCAVTVKSGAEFLSEPTKAEIEQLSEERRANGERLTCQAKIVGEGEIVVLTHEKKEEKPHHERVNEEFRKEFDALPLEQKVSRLMELEAVTLSETFSFILNSPYTLGGKLVEFLSGFGLKFEKDDKDAKRPDEHKEEPTAEEPENEPEKPAAAPDLDEAVEAEEKES
ncbi:MAG: (2Fe-2S)-binding protein [Acidobacteria bacterium]|nr:(2Fe-2S)-binding protein [Acidobacteriota bacterium]